MIRPAVLICVAAASAVCSTASAVGPSLPDLVGKSSAVAAATGEVRYTTTLGAAVTTVSAVRPDGTVIRARVLPGRWGVPLVTVNGATGGLGAAGRLLVLGDNVSPDGALRARSGFAVIDAATLRIRRTILLAGDFSFDALSPHGRTLYLIQHLRRPDAWSYRVRAYDLRSGRLVPGAIVDKRQLGWEMRGLPIARTAGGGGRWVYTLYQQTDNYPFIHALDTVGRVAVCIGLPWQWVSSAESIGSATLAFDGAHLVVRAGGGRSTRFVLDPRTFRVTATGEDTTA